MNYFCSQYYLLYSNGICEFNQSDYTLSPSKMIELANPNGKCIHPEIFEPIYGTLTLETKIRNILKSKVINP